MLITFAWTRTLAIALTASAAALMLPSSAVAMSSRAGEVQVSPDGVAFTAQYTGTLFESIGRLVPGDTQESKFFLRNTGDAPGYLRVTLREVTFTDTDFAHALTVAASTATRSGDPVVLGSVDPCWVLVEGQRVGVGETVAVTAKVALGNLDGVAGQGAAANAVVRVSLSDASAGALSPTDCGVPGTDIAVLPPSRNTPGNGSATVPSVPSASPLVSEEPSNEAGGDLPVLNLPGGIVIDPNTWHLYEEFLVLILLASFVLGSGWFMIVARRRRNSEEEDTDVTA